MKRGYPRKQLPIATDASPVVDFHFLLMPHATQKPARELPPLRRLLRLAVLGIVASTSIALGSTTESLTLDRPFKPTDESLRQYKCPEWFRDAKLGIWAVWGVGSVPMQGDWYSRHMYEQGHPQYEYHVEHYGHPSKFGFKDLIPLWKAEKWNPDQLMELYKKAGARYFVGLALYSDNIDYWDSKYTKWNSVNMGPHRNIIGEWANAARKQGLPFGVSEHRGWWWPWYDNSKGSDKSGPLAGVPYDGAGKPYHGNDPKFSDLYANAPEPIAWYARMLDLVDKYHPDLFYTDGPLPYTDEVGREFLSHYYNDNMQQHSGKLEAVFCGKVEVNGRFVQDLERKKLSAINPEPWQTDTLRRRLALQDGHQVQNPGANRNHARQHCQQERQFAAQFPGAS